VQRAATLLAVAAVLAGAAVGAGAAEARSVQRQVTADPRGQVIINNVNGSIDVSVWDRPEVWANADLLGDDLGLEVTSGGGNTRVLITGYESHRLGLFGMFSDSGDNAARLTVRVPRMSGLDVNAVSAQVHSAGVLGVQRLQSVSGDIRAQLAAADAEVKTVSGDIVLQGNGQGSHVTASSVSGDVTLNHGSGDLQATSISGSLQVSLDPAQSLLLRTTSGDISLGGALARGVSVTADTISGHVSMQARAAAGFGYDVTSFSGNIEDCFSQPPARNSQYGPGMHLSGTRGAGDGNVHIKTLSGEISLCDR
jgi:hypothetical protein